MTPCQGRPILGHGRSGSRACCARSLLWDIRLVSLILGSPFPTTKNRKVLSHKGFCTVPLKAFGDLGTETIKYTSLNLWYGYVEGESFYFIKVIQSRSLSVQKRLIRWKRLNRNPQRHKPGAHKITETSGKDQNSSATNWWAIKKLWGTALERHTLGFVTDKNGGKKRNRRSWGIWGGPVWLCKTRWGTLRGRGVKREEGMGYVWAADGVLKVLIWPSPAPDPSHRAQRGCRTLGGGAGRRG